MASTVPIAMAATTRYRLTSSAGHRSEKYVPTMGMASKGPGSTGLSTARAVSCQPATMIAMANT